MSRSVVAVLGSAGRIGSAIAAELSKETRIAVRLVDINPGYCLQYDVTTKYGLEKAVKGTDLVISALPSAMGYSVLKRLIDLRCNVIDLSFMSENPLELDAAAEAAGVTCVVDAGVAPGLSNLLVGHAAKQLETIDRVRIFAGGVPEVPCAPSYYKAWFAPADVLEEYTRPARYKVGGQTLVCENHLERAQSIKFQNTTYYAFVTDGLRTLLHTIDAPEMFESTIRHYPHWVQMRELERAGLLSKSPVKGTGCMACSARTPFEMVAAVMKERWEPDPSERDIMLLRVEVEGTISGGEYRRFEWSLVDYARDNLSAMQRTTAFTACAIAKQFIDNKVQLPTGVYGLEKLGSNIHCFEATLRYLKDRQVEIRKGTVV